MTSNQDWEDYKAKFNKRYKDDQEEQMRRELYFKAKQRVDEHNKLYEAKEVPYRWDVSIYSDYTQEEFSKDDGNVCKGFKGRLHRDENEPELPDIY